MQLLSKFSPFRIHQNRCRLGLRPKPHCNSSQSQRFPRLTDWQIVPYYWYTALCKLSRSVKDGWLCTCSKLAVLDLLVGLESREENRPFSGQQYQAQIDINPALKSRYNQKVEALDKSRQHK